MGLLRSGGRRSGSSAVVVLASCTVLLLVLLTPQPELQHDSRVCSLHSSSGGIRFVNGDFIYPDFNDTTGLVFNMNATTTSCDDSSHVTFVLKLNLVFLFVSHPALPACVCVAQYPYAHHGYHDHGANDRNDEGEAVPLMMV